MIIISAGVLLVTVIGGSSPGSDQKNISSPKTDSSTQTNAKPICNGKTVTTDCTVDGVNYTTYVYHDAVAEKSHVETVTTYQKKVVGYCTLCNDGTYSPSCATGRGACSYHGGVQEWNAPEYARVPVYSTNTVVDAPAQEAYYDKLAAK